MNSAFEGYAQRPKAEVDNTLLDQKFSSGDQNFIAGRQLATWNCKAGCYCRLSCSEKMIKN